KVFERALDRLPVGGARQIEVGCFLHLELHVLRFERIGRDVLERALAGEEEAEVVGTGGDAGGAAGGETNRHVRREHDRNVLHVRWRAERRMFVVLDDGRDLLVRGSNRQRNGGGQRGH